MINKSGFSTDVGNPLFTYSLYRQKRNLKILIKDMQLTFPVYLIDGLNIPCEEINYPYCFVSDSSLHANQVFIPDRSESKMTNLYLTL